MKVKVCKDNFEIKTKNSVLRATIIASLCNTLTNVKIFRIQHAVTLSAAEDTLQIFRLSSSTFVFTRAF